MRIRKMPAIFSKLYPGAWCTLPAKETKTVYITFDDGPHPQITPFVCELLAQYNAAATFFLIGNNMCKHPDFTTEWYSDRGHSVGNHTYHHLNGFFTENQIYFDDIKQCDLLVRSRLFRPPYGRIKFSQFRYLSRRYQIVLWDLVTYDWDPTLSPQSICSHIRSNVQNGSIIVFHDSEKAWNNMSKSLPEILKFLNQEGWNMAKLVV
ncbi:polysaccharide deacetylase family protein [Schleiferia thermophila]|uniref:Polysaccharide deacetylase n=1 Tax=Schleiferia thermophila TaxID=884107 RepID=A0A369A5D5_9FLAO|nr:polysaccharide deacetylase family protein [Schleiferia thermophila]KFD38502.1 polysaccharide deacetylase [Schleiferia thermophila str. Yellowstone]RCX03618.1 polysaccharide deacetylase [Schleiferia thermophila]